MGLITIREAADRLGVTPQRVHQMLAEFGIQPSRVTPRLFMLSPSQMRRLQKMHGRMVRPSNSNLKRATNVDDIPETENRRQ